MTAPQDPHQHLPSGRRLDPAMDPDRYDPAREGLPPDPVVSDGPLDWAMDPDRYDPDAEPPKPRQPLVLGRTGGTRQTLPDLLSEGSFEDKPNPYMFLIGLAGILAFLGLVAFVFSNISP